MKRAILILGDQLSDQLSSLADADPARDRVVMAELHEETHYVPHHRKKVALIFAAMRHFAQRLEVQGFRVHYFRYDPASSLACFADVLEDVRTDEAIGSWVVTEPGEYRLWQAMDQWPHELGIELEVRADNRFMVSHEQFQHWAKGRKSWRMENFYRDLRRRTNLLMDGDQPAGGQWNFDQDNRQSYDGRTTLPEVPRFAPDATTSEVLATVAEQFPEHVGSLDDFAFGVTAEAAEQALARFLEEVLPNFGPYQDAMVEGEPWLFHALLSFYLYIGLLDPLEVCQRAEQRYRDGAADIASVEGFVRQILGWREFVRGIYWACMPDYAERNTLEARRDLPWFYWTGDTDMNCMRQVITDTLEHAYAHHIQRLMITGNFALIAGVVPQQVCDWYLAVYADAFEWVELPNTLGMALHADGGVIGSKPYAAGGRYINKMSNYCGQCRYNVKTATEADSCPFNALYWDFIARNRDRFRGNPRMSLVVKNYDRMAEDKREALQSRAHWLLENLETL